MFCAWEFFLWLGRAHGDNGLRFGSGFGRRARVRGPAGFAVGALFRLCRGFFHFIITTAVSVRARWKKGQEKPEGNCFPSLVSQFMLGKWFSEVALQQNYDRGAWRHRVVSATSLFFARVMLCVMFSVSSWELFCDRVSPLERQGTQVAAPASPFFVFPTHHGGVMG